MIKKFLMLCVFSVSLVFASGGFAAEPDPAQIVKLSDAIRFPRESFQVDVNIVSVGNINEDKAYRVMSKGNENSIVATTSPAFERGQIMLMKGRDLWIFMPEVSQAIRLSASQRLTGQVANGDLARANFGADYTPTIKEIEVINGKKYWVLEMIGVDRTVTYNKVIYWVEVETHHPYKAEFYSMSGKLLKTCEYLNFKMILGKHRPTKLIMTDAMNKGTSTLVYEEMVLKNLPDKMFSKEYLNKINE